MVWSVVLLAVFAIIALNFAYRDTGPAVVVSAPHFVRPSALPGSLPDPGQLFALPGLLPEAQEASA